MNDINLKTLYFNSFSGSVEFVKSRLNDFLMNASEVAEKANYAEHTAALNSLIDTISIAMASHSIDTRVKKLRASILEGKTTGKFSIFGESILKSDAINALFINSFAAHALELDDWLPMGMLHPGASIIPSALLLGEKNDLTLEDITTGIIYGYQLAEHIGRWLGRSHYRTWHNTSTVAGIAIGAMLVWMEEGNEERITNAVLIATTYAGGLMPLVNKLVSVKPLSPSHASLIGYYSYLTSQAFTGLVKDIEAVESKICSSLTEQCDNIEDDESKTPAILRVGYKIFPTCRNSHTTIQAAIKLSEKVDPALIESIQLEVFEEAAQVADITFPTTIEEAMFSLSFLTAASLVKKWIGLKEISESLSDPLVRELEKKVKVNIREDYTMSFPKKHPVTIRVTMKTGEVLEEHEEIPLGDPSKTLPKDALYEKLRSLAKYSGNENILNLIELILKERINIRINDLIDKLSKEENK